MADTKSAIQSIGIWGGLIALIPSAVDAIDKVIPFLPAGPIVPIVAAVGAILSIFGRARAKGPIEGILPK